MPLSFDLGIDDLLCGEYDSQVTILDHSSQRAAFRHAPLARWCPKILKCLYPDENGTLSTNQR